MTDLSKAEQELVEKIVKLIQKAINDYNQDLHPEVAEKYYSPGISNQILALIKAAGYFKLADKSREERYTLLCKLEDMELEDKLGHLDEDNEDEETNPGFDKNSYREG